MQIAPPGGLRAGGAIDSLPRVNAHRLRRVLLPPATCGFVQLLELAGLRALRLDPETVRRHTTGIEASDRARARPANAGRAQISKWEVDGRSHDESLFDIYVVHDGAPGAMRLGPAKCLARPRNRCTGHIQNESRASMLSLAVRLRSRMALPRETRRAVNIGTRLPGGAH